MTGDTTFLALVELVSVALFIVGIKRLARIRTSQRGNQLAAAGMLLAVITTLLRTETLELGWVVAGLVVGGGVGIGQVARAKATQMPEIVARFNGFGGAASAVVAMALFWQAVIEVPSDQTAATVLGGTSATTLVLSVLIGGVTFSGSILAELKLRGTLSGMTAIPARGALMGLLLLGGFAVGMIGLFGTGSNGVAAVLVLLLVAASLIVGLPLVLPIGGADMPVVISLLNSMSGLAAAATGFALGNNLLIIAGTMVGAAGLILTQVMCVAMNRSLIDVLAGGFGGEQATGAAAEYENVRSAGAEEAAMVFEAAQSVLIVPGYGLAAARAQHSAWEFAKALEARGCNVRFAVHPVAGRMPGHMNVVLAEADVPYDRLVEMSDVNHEFKTTDVALVVGANDVVNPTAREASGSPIAGMPILNADEASQVFVIKRSLSPGYAGIKNELFEQPNCTMLFGDAKEMLQAMVGELQGAPVA